MKQNIFKSASTIAIVLASANAFGVAYDVRTTTTATGTTVTDRLFLDPAFSVKAPSTTAGAPNTGSVLWFVADKNNDGLKVPTGGSGNVSPSSILGADDEIIFNTEVDGTIIGNQAGRYQRIGVTIPDAFNSANIPVYAFLWNPTTPGGLGTPDSLLDVIPGMTFGISEVAVTLDTPDPGNGRWNIWQNINGSQYTVFKPVATPDAASVTSVGALAIAGLMMARRRSAK